MYSISIFYILFSCFCFLLFGSLIHQGVRCLYCLLRRLPPSLPVLGCLEGSMCREPRPLLDVVNIGSSGSAFASFTLRLPLYNCFCEIQLFLPTHVTKIGHFSLDNDSIQLSICVEVFKNRNISSFVFIGNIEESSIALHFCGLNSFNFVTSKGPTFGPIGHNGPDKHFHYFQFQFT